MKTLHTDWKDRDNEFDLPDMPQSVHDCGPEDGEAVFPLDMSGLASEAGIDCRFIISHAALRLLMPGVADAEFAVSVRFFVAKLAELGSTLHGYPDTALYPIEVGEKASNVLVVHKNLAAAPPFVFVSAFA